MILRCWSGRAAVAALGWEMPARLGVSLLIPPRGSKTGHKSLAGCSAMGHLEMLSIVSACPAA